MSARAGPRRSSCSTSRSGPKAGQVHRRVGVEEAVRLQHESDPVHRHHGPVFGPGECGCGPKVYQTTRSVSAIGRLASVHWGSPSPSTPLVRVIARCIPLACLVRGDPQVAPQEPGPSQHRCVVLREGDGVLRREQAISDRLTHPVLHALVGDLPVAAGTSCCTDAVPPAHALTGCALRNESVAVGVLLAARQASGVHLVY